MCKGLALLQQPLDARWEGRFPSLHSDFSLLEPLLSSYKVTRYLNNSRCFFCPHLQLRVN